MDMMKKEHKKGQLGVGIAVIIGVIALVILFAMLPIVKTSIESANLTGNDATISGVVVTLLVIVAIAIVVGLIVLAFRAK